MIQVQDVRVAIDGVEILHGVSFEIAAGSVACLLRMMILLPR